MSGLRLLWMATADARGHLMRAQLLWHELTSAGVELDVWTTSESGVRFLAACGVPARLLSPHYRMVFDGRQNLLPLATDLLAARYLIDPRRLSRDLDTLAAHAARADLVINDSFHPALIVAPVLARCRSMRVVHVYAHELRAAVQSHYFERLPRPVARAFLKALLAIQAISALDTAGAMLQAAGLPIGNASKEQLAYRTNADALS